MEEWEENLSNYIYSTFGRNHRHYIYELLNSIDNNISTTLLNQVEEITEEKDFFDAINYLESLTKFINDKMYILSNEIKLFQYSLNPFDEEQKELYEYQSKLESKNIAFSNLYTDIIKLLIDICKDFRPSYVNKQAKSTNRPGKILLNTRDNLKAYEKSNLKHILDQMLNELKDQNFIKKNLPKNVFMQLFSIGSNVFNENGYLQKIIWTGHKSELAYFIDSVYKSNIVDPKMKSEFLVEKWNITCRYFEDSSGHVFKNNHFAKTNHIPRSGKTIDLIVNAAESDLMTYIP